MKYFIRSIVLLSLVNLYAVSQARATPLQYQQFGNDVQVAQGVVKIMGNKTMKAETTKIISVLEDWIKDPEVLAKTTDKLRILSDEKVRLASLLCDRISDGQRTARDDIVFSLVSALIVFS